MGALSIRNPEGIWINTEPFREEAKRFEKHGYFCGDPYGSYDWVDYWKEQRERCDNGYSVGGVKITGDHYMYLNFCPIRKTKDQNARRAPKITGFPNFWDGDYNFFWVRELARKGVFALVAEDEETLILKAPKEEQLKKMKELFDSLHLEVVIKVDYLYGGWNLIVGKARRKGYSYKNAAIAVNNYICRPDTLTLLGAYEKKFLYPRGLFTMAFSYINFLSKHTGWAYPRDVINQPGKGHIKASTIEYEQGVPIETGFMSEIMSTSFKDDPDSGRGKDAYDVLIEEAGAFGSPGLLKETLNAMQDTAKDGDVKTGMITVFGTSGDMEGGTADYASMHEKPAAYGFLPFQNIWDEDAQDRECGFFHPDHWNLVGHMDEQGNSNIASARAAEKAHRKFLLSKGATSSDIQRRMQERPSGPFEAFGVVTINDFPILELKKQLDIVLSKDLHLTKGTPVNLYYNSEKKKVVAEPILDGSADPIYRRKPENLSLRGCPIIYEYPAEDVERLAYKIGYDPYRHSNGTSLAAVYVYKSVIRGQHLKHVIVAEYVGRPGEAGDVNNIARLFAELYNTQVMHENEVTHVKDWFRRGKYLHLLAHQPDAVISKHVKKSVVSRVYGMHMTDKLKDAGEKYIKDWLNEIQDYDENGSPITTIDRIFSPGLLEELINYNRKGNFDRVMALMMALFQVQEEEIGKEYKPKSETSTKVTKLLAMQEKMYRKPQRSLFR